MNTLILIVVLIVLLLAITAMLWLVHRTCEPAIRLIEMLADKPD